MASSLISGAVSLMLILIAGYVIATGILTIAETTIYSQNEMSSVYESIQQTVISIDEPHWDTPTLTFNAINNGSTSFKLTDMGYDFFICSTSNVTTRYSTTEMTMTITNDIINKGFWDPSEILHVEKSGLGYVPNWIKIVTPNGVTASSTVS